MMAAVGTASAVDHGFYAGVDAGLASYPDHLDIDLSRTIYKVESSTHKDFAWTFTAGYRFNRYFALEAGFSDLGQFSSTLVDASGATTSHGKIDLMAKGKTLAALVHIPTSNNWDPYLKLGAIDSIVDVRVEAKFFDTGFAFTDRNYGPRAFLGVGARYAYTERWALSFAVDYYIRMGNGAFMGNTNILAPRAGFAYRF
jgi:OmpA-OmpF porin, OOP family